MATIGAYTIAIIAVFIICYFERFNIDSIVSLTEGESQSSVEQELNALAHHYQISKNQQTEHFINVKAIWRYIHFIYSTTEEEKRAFRQQSNVDAERLLDQYRLVLQEQDYDKRIQLMENWKHTFRLYYKNKPTEHIVKGKIVEVNFQR